MFATLEPDLPTAKETINKLWEGDLTPLGADAAAQELSVMSLAAFWQATQVHAANAARIPAHSHGRRS